MKNTAFISGKFNVIHPGHLRIFKLAKSLAKTLIVGVECDEMAKGHVQLDQYHRLEVVGRIDLVDKAVLIKDSVTSLISNLKPDIVLKGKEFENLQNIEQEALKEYGGQLLFSSGDTHDPSIEYETENNHHVKRNAIELSGNFLKRHNISVQNLENIIGRFSSIRVCVIGDLIVDEYIQCHPIGMSQEDSTIVVNPTKSDIFIGGAGIVAAHARAMGSDVTYLSVTGIDQVSHFARDYLNSMGVKLFLIDDEDRPTTHKKKYRFNNQTMFRVNYFRDEEISREVQNKFTKKLLEIAKDIDLIIFSDFNYGCLPTTLINKIARIAKTHNILTVADSQTSSQIGDILRFKNMLLVTPTEHEARVALMNRKDGLEQLCRNLIKKSKCKNIFLKLGKNGLLAVKAENNDTHEYCVDTLPSFNNSPVDVSGAGDSMLVAGSLAMAVGANLWEASLLGSIAASIQVSRVGNKPINLEEILKALKE